MNFNPCIKHNLVRNKVREFAETELGPVAAEIDREVRFPGEVILKMRGLNFFGLQVPREFGSVGIDSISYAIVIKELSRLSAAVGLCVTVHNSVDTYCGRCGSDLRSTHTSPARQDRSGRTPP